MRDVRFNRKMVGRNRLKTMSDALKFLMVQNREYLRAQTGKPPIGRCLDCKRDILAMEFAAMCPKCTKALVCYNCVDKHDHLNLHDFMEDLLKMPVSPSVN